VILVSPPSGWPITREYEPYLETDTDPPAQVQGNTLGRPRKIQVGVDGDEDRDYEMEHHYAGADGRLARITGPGLPAYGAAYTYEADSDLVSDVDFMSDSSTTLARTLFFYDDHRRRDRPAQSLDSQQPGHVALPARLRRAGPAQPCHPHRAGVRDGKLGHLDV
jgi:hypothetical protein